MRVLVLGVLIGCGATALLDLRAILLHRAFASPLPNWALVGGVAWLQAPTLASAVVTGYVTLFGLGLWASALALRPFA